ncbi:hypothetical protein NP233_g2136 [Leucocoprinus birnbaumii]|uniref:Uncharacterized protein n=1 Tax=Leucocoprinus birnbaumii TaxID=56174 RepID=A0AAD5YZ07_9AGAR|nr:hypothetical protein NP233_g2136 [Leucocoprinus birnbaumii]
MPSFNFFRSFGGSKHPSSRPAPILAKDYAYNSAAAPLPISPAISTSYSRSASMPPEILKSQPITDPSLGRRGTLKKKNKHRRHMLDDSSTTPVDWLEPSHTHHDDILPGPPPGTAHQSSGYEPTAVNAPIFPEEYPYTYEDNHQQRFQYNTTTGPGAPMPSGTPGFENGPPPSTGYPEPPPRGGMHPEPNGRHHGRHRHRHHRHQYQPQPPQPYEYDPSYAAPSTHGHEHSPHRHASWGPEHSRSRSRSFTPIPAVYREPDSMDLEDSYADPAMRASDTHMGGLNGNRRSPYHEPEGLGLEFDDRGPPQNQPPPMIAWHPSAGEHQMNEEPQRMHEPEAAFVGEMEPQVITPPVESENPLRTNIYHTRQPDYDPNARHRRQRTPAQEYAHESRHRDPRGTEEPRKKAYMYRDFHHSETIEPRMHERRASYGDSGSEPEEYRYIVPSGVHVVFRDHDGNEITRIGEPGHVPSGRFRRDMSAFTVQDEHGKILYRHGPGDGGRHRDDRYLRSGHPNPPRRTKVIMIDEHENQMILRVIPADPTTPMDRIKHIARTTRSIRTHPSTPSTRTHPTIRTTLHTLIRLIIHTTLHTLIRRNLHIILNARIPLIILNTHIPLTVHITRTRLNIHTIHIVLGGDEIITKNHSFSLEGSYPEVH